MQLIRYKDYEIECTSRANCSRFVLRSREGEKHFTLSVPLGSSYRSIERFLRENEAWMNDHSQRLQTWQPRYEAGERHMLLGQRVLLGANGIPTGADFIQYRYEQFEALALRLIKIWQERMNVQVSRLAFREMKSQWGSCSSGGRVCLNTRLALYPEDCVELVVVHELCHLRAPNHSAVFHELLSMYLPSWKEREQRMNTMDVKALPAD